MHDQDEESSSAALVIWGSYDALSSTVSEQELNSWWTFEHLPERLAVPGFLQCRRYHTKDPSTGMSNYLVLYKTSDLKVLTSREYMKALNNPTDRTKRCMPVLAKLDRSACRVVHSKSRSEGDIVGKSRMIGGTLLHIVIEPPSDSTVRNSLRQHLVEVVAPEVLQFPTTLTFDLLEHDLEATQIGSKTKSYVDTQMQITTGTYIENRKWMILVDLAETTSLDPSGSVGVAGFILKQLEIQQIRPSHTQTYQLLCYLTR